MIKTFEFDDGLVSQSQNKINAKVACWQTFWYYIVIRTIT